MSLTLLGAEVRLVDPWALLLLAAVLIGVVVKGRRERRPGGGLLFSSVALVADVGASWRARLRWIPLALRLAAATLLIIGLARPQIGYAALEIPAEGIDIAVVLDVSSSMASRDFGGTSRIDAAKKVLREFLAGLKNDRAGVVVFASEALVLSPLTLDYAAPERLVEPIVPGKILPDGTAIGTGIATGLNLLRESQAKSRVVILLTDGENNMGDIAPLDAAEIARLLGVRVYTVGVVPRSAAVSVDERVMQRVSDATEGRYYRASDEGALLEVYRQIQKLEKARVGTRGLSASYEDAHLLLLASGASLLLLEMLLAASVFRRVP